MAYVTVSQCRTAFDVLSSSGTFSDQFLADLITEFESIASDYRGVSHDIVTSREVRRVAKVTDQLRLFHAPIRTVSSVTVDGTEVTDYDVNHDQGLILGSFYDCEVVVTYTHGLGYRVLTDAALTTSSTTLTSTLGAFDSYDIGIPVSHTKLPPGTRIASINSTTSATLSQAATGGASAATVSLVDPTLARAAIEYVRSCAVNTKTAVPRDVITQSVEGMTTRFSTADKAYGRPTGFLDVDRLLNAITDRRPMVL